ncbi:hypothetical protein KR215_000933, partial [Drosophila sulfurigaster]
MRSVKTEPRLKDLAQLVKGIRKTAKGELLFELVRASDPNTKVLQEAVSTLLGDKAEVRMLSETVSLEVKDIDELTTEAEILEALVTQFGGTDISRSSLQSLRPAYGGTQTATLRVSGGLAGKLLSAGKIRIGWVICRIRQKAAVWSCGGNPAMVSEVKSGSFFVRARIGPIYFYSCYLPPSMDLQSFRAATDELADDARSKTPCLIAGDFNAWATEWGSARTNDKGQALLEALATLDVVLLNSGNQYTFSRGSMGSTIDVTFVSGSLSRRASWKVCGDYT